MGPAGIRLQEVAADAGVSHPTVLHHFGSREHLVKAVTVRALGAIHAQIVDAIGASTGEEEQLAAMLEAVFDAISRTGHARVLMWLALEGHRVEFEAERETGGPGLAAVIEAAHALRKAKLPKGVRAPPREDTAHVVVLCALALVASSVMGSTLFENAGLGADPAAGAKFRAWLARWMKMHLDAGT